jgi:O-antigen/teichoic acid export membrane protein
MLTKVKSLYNNAVFTGTLFVTAGSFIGSIFSYLLQLGLGRLLSVENYGTFNALLSLSVLLTIPTGALLQSIIKTVAELRAKEKYSTLTKMFVQLTVLFMLVGFVLFAVIYTLRHAFAEYLTISQIHLFLPFAIFLMFSFLTINTSAYLQGLLRFKALAFYNAFTGFMRFMIPISFVFLGFGVGGVFYGLILTSVIVFAVGILLLRKNFDKFDSEDLKPYYKGIARFGIVTLFVGIGTSFLNNIDMILVKRFFDGDVAGIYAAVVTIGKIFLFGAGTVVILMYPQISNLHAKGENFIPKLKQFLSVQLFFIAGGVGIFFFFPRLITVLLFGERFLPAVQYVPLFTIFIALYILANFMIMFLLAINKTRVWMFLIPAVVAQFVLIKLFHTSLNQVIWVNVGVTVFLLVGLLVYSLFAVYNQANNKS